MSKSSNGFFVVDGYNAFNKLNLVLAAISGVAFALIYIGVSGGTQWDNSATICVLVAVACLGILLFRNRKLKSIPKMIIFSLISCVFGLIAVVAYIAFAMLCGGIPVSGKNANRYQSNNAPQWTEQYSSSKGTYYTDGQGNFKDQYGNDVYNPQGITDYDNI